MKKIHPSAFTLIELSIILVIIGLLTGGVMAGRVMMRQSHVTSVMTDAQRYISVTGEFQKKYGSLPGDLANATDYWGAAGGSAPYTDSCYTSTLPGTATCNGNGNGQIGNSISNPDKNEMLRVWQHLANAGYITGTYSGTTDSVHQPGINCPKSAAGGGFGMRFIGTVSSTNPLVFQGDYGHALFFSAMKAINVARAGEAVVSKTATFDWALSGGEAQSLDAKFDDGLPVLGNIRAWKKYFSATVCTTASDSTATYSTTNELVCGIILITGF